MTLTRRITFLAVVLIAQVAVAQNSLDQQVRQMVRSADLRSTAVSIMAVDLTTGEELVRLNADEPMMPASNMKLVTTAAAAGVLGPDFAFRTELRLIQPDDWAGQMALPGDQSKLIKDPVLVVAGDGDPAFGDPKILAAHNLDAEQLFSVWVKAVKDKGVKQVARLIIDDRIFDRTFVHPTWPTDQLDQWYCAPVAGLNFYDNCLDVYPQPTKPDQSPRVVILPPAPFLNTSNRAVTGTEDTFWVSRKPGTNDLTFWGKVKTPRTQPINVTVHDPALLFGQMLAYRLAQNGVKVGVISRPGADDQLPAGTTLHVMRTTLPVVLARCNKDSQNLFAEALIKRMGRRVTGAPGSWENGAAAIRIFLRDRLNIQSTGIQIADGSGMSRGNRVTARALIDILHGMHRDRELGLMYRQSLSIGGRDGTLRDRYKKGLTGRVYGKSGYINGVTSLSGYLVINDRTDASGTTPAPGRGAGGPAERVVAFSFLFNDVKPPVFPHKLKTLSDQIVDLIDAQVAAQIPRAPVGLGG